MHRADVLSRYTRQLVRLEEDDVHRSALQRAAGIDAA
jgi:hypothetical protein